MDYVLGPWPLLALDNIESNRITFNKSLVSVTGDTGVVDKNIAAVTASDESVTLPWIEPLNCTVYHRLLLLNDSATTLFVRATISNG